MADDEEEFEWPKQYDGRDLWSEHEFHGSWFTQCPLCGALLGSYVEDVHKAWHIKMKG